MKRTALLLLVTFCSLAASRADVVLVQKIEGAGPGGEMTLKIKGDKARVDVTPELSTLIDSSNGDIITIMKAQKTFMRMSSDKVKAVAETAAESLGQDTSAPKPKLVATGRREKINGYDTEEYACKTPGLKAAYWVTTQVPDYATVLKQLQNIKPTQWQTKSTMPEISDLPGVPIRSVVKMGNQPQITTTITSITQEPVADSEFAIPTDFTEMQLPDMTSMIKSMGGMKKPKEEKKDKK